MKRKKAIKKKAPARRKVAKKAKPTKKASRRVRVVRRPKSAVATAPAMLALPEALKIAISFEHKVRDHYDKGARAISDPRGAKVFASLAKEEQGHVAYLESRLAEWTETGKVDAKRLASILPDPQWVRDAEARHRASMSLRKVAVESEVELLKGALRLEQQASTFYHDLVNKLPAADRALFEQFLDIEDGHLAIVQAELDSVQGLGYWFDVQEFALEAM